MTSGVAERVLTERELNRALLARQLLLETAAIEAAAERIGEHHVGELAAHLVVHAPHHRDAVRSPVRGHIVLAGEIALLRALEQIDDPREPVFHVLVLQQERDRREHEQIE